MVKTIFKYGTMASGKTSDLLTQNFNFNNTGLDTILIKPKIDNRSGNDIIKSRIGLKKTADWVISSYNQNQFIKELPKMLQENKILFFDESQFYDTEMIDSIFNTIVEDKYNNSKSIIFFYGLLTDFENNLFKGTQHLVALCDELVELPTPCEYPKCTRKARFNYLDKDAQQKAENQDNILIGDNIYHAYCWKHYKMMQNKTNNTVGGNNND